MSQKGLTDLVKPFALEQRGDPIDNTINYAGRNAIHNHRASDGEYLGAHAQDKAFCLCQLRTQCFSKSLMQAPQSLA